MKIFRYTLLTVFFIVGLTLLPYALYGQQQADQPPAEPTAHHQMPEGRMQGEVEIEQQPSDRLMPHHQRMMTKVKEMDAQLEEKVKAMNEATGEQKVAAMAAVLNELLAQRKVMHRHMSAMQGRMCKMMDQDESRGRMHWMSGCPKMKMKQGKMDLPEGLEGKNVVVIIQE